MPTEEHSNQSPTFPSLRLGLGLIAVLVQLVAVGVSLTPSVNNFLRFVFMMAGPAVALLLFMIWIFFRSRLTKSEAWLSFFAIVPLGLLTGLASDPSMGTSLWAHGVPLVLSLITLVLFLLRRNSGRTRWSLGIAFVAWSVFLLGRLDGIDGSYLPHYDWRWSATLDERFDQRRASMPTEQPTMASLREDLEAAWPGFRGLRRDGRVFGVSLAKDWTPSEPVETWRIPVGSGWSSFAFAQERLFTQEQRGDEEAVVCYDASSGNELWCHRYPARFSEIVAGAGPRSTPCYWQGQVIAYGALADLICVSANTGEELWKHNLMQELDAELPVWGFSSSPIVVDGKVIVYAGGKEDFGLVAYGAKTGELAWRIKGRGMNFASAQEVVLDGIKLVLFTFESGLFAIEGETGKVMWQYTPSGWKKNPMVQPQAIGDDGILVALGDGVGLTRLSITRSEDQWTIEEKWSSPRLRPSFNDFVHHEGHIYGFDQNSFSCIDVEDGSRQWRGGRYGFGQVLLVQDSDSLLVITEKGDLVHLDADPRELRERGRIPVFESKTWNHPILIDNRLFLRNGEDAVCVRLPSLP